MNRLVWIGLGVVAAVAAGAAGVHVYAQQRATAEVDAALATLRQNGMTTSRGPVRLDLLSRKLEVSDVVVRAADGSGATVSTITATGVDLLAKDFVAKRVEASGIEVVTRGTTPAGNVQARLPKAVATDVRMARTTAPGGSSDALAAFLGGLSAGSIDAPTISVQTGEGAVAGAKPAATTGGTSTSPRVELGALRIEGVKEGKVQEVALDKLGVQGAPAAQLSVNRLSLRRLDAIGLGRLAVSVASSVKPPSLENLQTVVTHFEGIDLRGTEIPMPYGTIPAKVEQMTLEWGNLVGGVPTKLGAVGKLSIPLDASKPEQKALIDRGMPSLIVSGDLGAAWTEATGKVAITANQLDIEKLAKVRFSGELGNVPKSVFVWDKSKVMEAMPTFELGPVSLEVRDQGLLAGGNATDRAEVIRNVGLLKDQVAAAPQPSAGMLAIVDSLAKYMSVDGQTLKLALKPKAPLAIGRIGPETLATPVTMGQLVDNFEVTASAGP